MTSIDTAARSRRMSGLEYAVTRHLIGLTGDELADQLGVTPRTARAWEAGSAPIPYAVPGELASLRAQHDQLVARYLDAEEAIGIVREKGHAPMPRGWYVAAAARALESEPHLMVEWV